MTFILYASLLLLLLFACRMWIFDITHSLFVHFAVEVDTHTFNANIYLDVFSCDDRIKEQAIYDRVSNYFCIQEKLSTELSWTELYILSKDNNLNVQCTYQSISSYRQHVSMIWTIPRLMQKLKELRTIYSSW